MKNEDLRELRAKLAGLPAEMTADNQPLFAEFGQLCATKYLPQLLRAAGLNRETPEFEPKSCDSCFWKHQTVQVGCAKCLDKSEYINMFNPAAAKRCAEYYQTISSEN